jgi:hypothetical protein
MYPPSSDDEETDDDRVKDKEEEDNSAFKEEDGVTNEDVAPETDEQVFDLRASPPLAPPQIVTDRTVG